MTGTDAARWIREFTSELLAGLGPLLWGVLVVLVLFLAFFVHEHRSRRRKGIR